ncbi:hypothetical protein OF001_U20089 [Pseudomonas sp. OF001]|nr:hypothetical protein OF001_U20089 [Pseudomonas sp. OF001]
MHLANENTEKILSTSAIHACYVGSAIIMIVSIRYKP